MKLNKFLTIKDKAILKEERVNKIISSFSGTFKKIKRIDENFEEEELTEEELDEGVPLTDGKEDNMDSNNLGLPRKKGKSPIPYQGNNERPASSPKRKSPIPYQGNNERPASSPKRKSPIPYQGNNERPASSPKRKSPIPYQGDK